MRRLEMKSLLLCLLAGLVCLPRVGLAAEAGGAEFQEVYGLIREHLSGVSETELNHAAVKGLIGQLGPRVSLVGQGAGTNSAVQTGSITRSSVFDGAIGYLRIGGVAAGLSSALKTAYESLAASNKLQGVVVDLRYSAGQDYAAAADTADLFAKKQRPLLNWGTGMVESKDKADAISVPVAVLVNGETTGAAEALAAVLRELGVSLLLGGKTAGTAMLAEEYTLKNGQKLRIATSPIELGNGSKLGTEGITPDIVVKVSPQDERNFYVDATKASPSQLTAAEGALSLTNVLNGTNRAGRRVRLNEAELVRERREGLRGEDDGGDSSAPEAEKGVVYDPALARALDVLKGLAVVRQSRS